MLRGNIVLTVKHKTHKSFNILLTITICESLLITLGWKIYWISESFSFFFVELPWNFSNLERIRAEFVFTFSKFLTLFMLQTINKTFSFHDDANFLLKAIHYILLMAGKLNSLDISKLSNFRNWKSLWILN